MAEKIDDQIKKAIDLNECSTDVINSIIRCAETNPKMADAIDLFKAFVIAFKNSSVALADAQREIDFLRDLS